jgi:hypothetical protein
MKRFSRSIKIVFVFLALSLPFFSGWGCGYRLRGTGEPIGIQVKSLAIPLMTSTSSSLGFEADFTRIIRQEFIDHAKVPLVPKETAHAVLLGRITEIKTEPLSYRVSKNRVNGRNFTYEETRTRRLSIRLAARLVDRVTGKVIWEAADMEEKASFKVDSDTLAQRYYERMALQETARRFAKRLYLRTMERF